MCMHITEQHISYRELYQQEHMLLLCLCASWAVYEITSIHCTQGFTYTVKHAMLFTCKFWGFHGDNSLRPKLSSPIPLLCIWVTIILATCLCKQIVPSPYSILWPWRQRHVPPTHTRILGIITQKITFCGAHCLSPLLIRSKCCWSKDGTLYTCLVWLIS